MKRQIIAVGVASSMLLLAGVAVACNKVDESPTPTPSVSVSPSPSPSTTPSVSPTPSPKVTSVTPAALPHVGGTGHNHR